LVDQQTEGLRVSVPLSPLRQVTQECGAARDPPPGMTGLADVGAVVAEDWAESVETCAGGIQLDAAAGGTRSRVDHNMCGHQARQKWGRRMNPDFAASAPRLPAIDATVRRSYGPPIQPDRVALRPEGKRGFASLLPRASSAHELRTGDI